MLINSDGENAGKGGSETENAPSTQFNGSSLGLAILQVNDGLFFNLPA